MTVKFPIGFPNRYETPYRQKSLIEPVPGSRYRMTIQPEFCPTQHQDPAGAAARSGPKPGRPEQGKHVGRLLERLAIPLHRVTG
jgi:hypothetical protein